MAEASFDQAKQAFEKFLASAQSTASSIENRGETVRAGAKDVSTKAIAYAEKNVAASLDYAQQLLHAKDLGICRDMAARLGVHLPVVDSMLAEYAELIAQGYGDEDISATHRLKQALFEDAREGRS
jgi:3-hydroxyisobutyrate dehydrogenase-like beta-hydroxyacid dehydrogenase